MGTGSYSLNNNNRNSSIRYTLGRESFFKEKICLDNTQQSNKLTKDNPETVVIIKDEISEKSKKNTNNWLFKLIGDFFSKGNER